jgi:hypothetical protein
LEQLKEPYVRLNQNEPYVRLYLIIFVYVVFAINVWDGLKDATIRRISECLSERMFIWIISERCI